MGFWTLFEAASAPVLQVLIVGGLGAFLASSYSNILHTDVRKNLNKVVFAVFTPALMFANLAETVTLQEIISWWFMPVNIGLVFLFGSGLGWIVAKIFKSDIHIKKLIIAACSAGNFGGLMLILVPAVCFENGSPFRGGDTCSVRGAAYASFSMALGGFYIWTYTYHLIKTAGELCHHSSQIMEKSLVPNPKLQIDPTEHLLLAENGVHGSYHAQDAHAIMQANENIMHWEVKQLLAKAKGIFHQLIDELLAPPTTAAVCGFTFGAIPWLKHLLIGSNAPLHIVQDSIKLLGGGTVPSITLILGGNLTRVGWQSNTLKSLVILSIIIVRYGIMPIIGVSIVKTASTLGLLSADPLYRYVLMLQFTLPPAMNIGTMAQLFDVMEEESSIIFLWTYLMAAPALAVWSTFYMWILK